MTQELDAIARRLQALEDQAEIRKVLYTYFRAVDAADWDLMASCYHPDAIDEHSDIYTGPIDGLVQWCIDNVATAFSSWMHFGGQSVIDVDGDTAQSETYAVAIHKTHADEKGFEADVIAGGRFFDRFERRDGAWRIAHRKLVISWIPSAPVSEDANLLSVDGR
ncbi:nuclear transport factor 2 family protein [Microbacterium sp. RD1]|uniref:nuclear transport factor 2 family protein n=1 Tax=Microbacterium sp. RD1 TaxID=3457313 RepID=UPI003FA52975